MHRTNRDIMAGATLLLDALEAKNCPTPEKGEGIFIVRIKDDEIRLIQWLMLSKTQRYALARELAETARAMAAELMK